MKETKLTPMNTEIIDFELFEQKYYSKARAEIYQTIFTKTKGKIKPVENDFQSIFNDTYLLLIQKISDKEFVHHNDAQTWIYISRILHNKCLEYCREMSKVVFIDKIGQHSDNEDESITCETNRRRDFFSEKLENQYYRSFGAFAMKYREHLTRNLEKVRKDRLLKDLDEDFFYSIEKEYLEVFINKFKELKAHYQLSILYILQKQYSYKQMLEELSPFYQDTISTNTEDAYGYWRVTLQRAKEELFNLIFETFKQKNIWKR